jgi:glucose/arabinose dehydrogenase
MNRQSQGSYNLKSKLQEGFQLNSSFRVATSFIFAAALLASSSQFASAQGTTERQTQNLTENQTQNTIAKVVIEDLENPWAVVTGPDRKIYITQTGGQIRVYNENYKFEYEITGLPDLNEVGQGGLLDIAFHPKFQSNRWIYVAYTTGQGEATHTRISRFELIDQALKNHKILLEGPSGEDDGAHFGCRLVFDSKGQLFATFGDRHHKEKAQDLNFLNGKIVRLNDDGSIPSDNPFGAKSPVYSYGHRNPQGLAIHPLTKKMFDTEHGPSGYDAPGGGDEVNVVKAGQNYGWPNVHHDLQAPNIISPLKEYTPAVAPSGAVFYDGELFANWKNDFFMATLRGRALHRLRFDQSTDRVVESEVLLQGQYGRLRDVGVSPSGALLVLSEDGQLIEVKPRLPAPKRKTAGFALNERLSNKMSLLYSDRYH